MSTPDQIPSDLLQRVTSLAAQDRGFRQLLLDDPVAAVKATFGVLLPPTFRVRFVERPPDVDAVIVLDALQAAPPADGSLSDADLDAVAGGHDPVDIRDPGVDPDGTTW
jgi:hypothetical protein